MLFDLFIPTIPAEFLGNYEIVNDNPLPDATRRYYFQTNWLVGAHGAGNEKTVPETSVPRGPPLRCPSTGPQEIVRMYRRNITGRRVFIVQSRQWE